MGTARVAQVIAGSLERIETAWCDTRRWPAWVDGLDHVISVQGAWPREGAIVTWVSGPAGRGTVTERVTAYEERAGQTLEVQDRAIHGRQSVSFTPARDGVEVALALQYDLRHRSIITPVMDVLFIRRAMASSMARTLSRFGANVAPGRAEGPSSAGDRGQ
jgi:hypothetical protein